MDYKQLIKEYDDLAHPLCAKVMDRTATHAEREVYDFTIMQRLKLEQARRVDIYKPEPTKYTKNTWFDFCFG